MNKPFVFATSGVLKEAVLLLKKKGYVVRQGKNIKKEGKGAEGIVCLLTDSIDKKVMDAVGPQLRVISNMASGIDNIDVEEAKRRKIEVTNTPGVLVEVVAEHAVALLLALSRRIVEGDSFARAGKYKGWKADLLLGSELEGKTLGIVGHGRIGCRLAEILQKGFGMKVIYYDVHREQKKEVACVLTYTPLPQLFKKSDVVSLHVPLMKSTSHMIGRKELQLMKNTAVLINTARGGVIDEQALVTALQQKEIEGAGLDVFEHEPKISSGLKKLKNVVLTPHIASSSHEARLAMAELAAKNTILVLENV